MCSDALGERSVGEFSQRQEREQRALPGWNQPPITSLRQVLSELHYWITFFKGGKEVRLAGAYRLRPLVDV